MSKFKDNVPGFPGYHVTKDGEVYSMKCRSGNRVENLYWGTYKENTQQCIQDGMLVRDICNKYSIGHTTLNNYLRRLNIVRHR